MERCWVTLHYGWGDEGLALARTSNQQVMAMVKSVLLAEAQERADISYGMDPIVAALDRAEVRRLLAVLEQLIPEQEEGASA